MSQSKVISDSLKQKLIQEKCQVMLSELLRIDDNKYCADCDAKGPRWSSWNIGVLLCIRCAGVHRKLGVHISKVKSINLDSWQPEQVVSLQNMGNLKGRQIYEANLPSNFRRPVTDSSLEQFIRAKYEYKRYILKDWSPPENVQSIRVEWDKEIRETLEAKKKSKMTTLPTMIKLPTPPSNQISTGSKTNMADNFTDSLFDFDEIGTEVGTEVDNDLILVPEVTNHSSKQVEYPKSLKAEELDFFNQPMLDSVERLKRTKDSIMALYNQNGSSNCSKTAATVIETKPVISNSFLDDINRKLAIARSQQESIKAANNSSETKMVSNSEFDQFMTYQKFK